MSHPFACGRAVASSIVDSLSISTFFHPVVFSIFNTLVFGQASSELDLVATEGAGKLSNVQVCFTFYRSSLWDVWCLCVKLPENYTLGCLLDMRVHSMLFPHEQIFPLLEPAFRNFTFFFAIFGSYEKNLLSSRTFCRRERPGCDENSPTQLSNLSFVTLIIEFRDFLRSLWKETSHPFQQNVSKDCGEPPKSQKMFVFCQDSFGATEGSSNCSGASIFLTQASELVLNEGLKRFCSHGGEGRLSECWATKRGIEGNFFYVVVARIDSNKMLQRCEKTHVSCVPTTFGFIWRTNFW